MFSNVNDHLLSRWSGKPCLCDDCLRMVLAQSLRPLVEIGVPVEPQDFYTGHQGTSFKRSCMDAAVLFALAMDPKKHTRAQEHGAARSRSLPSSSSMWFARTGAGSGAGLDYENCTLHARVDRP